MPQPVAHAEMKVLALDLLAEVQPILAEAINSLGNKTPPNIETTYLFQPAVGLNRAAEGFLFLRKNFRVHASKLLVRPSIELLIYGTAALKSKEFHFRKAYSEWREDKKLFVKTPADEAEANKALAKLEQTFTTDYPGYPIKREKLYIWQAAEMAGLKHLYETQFAVYCQYTHGSLRALSGDLDEATDPHDTTTVCWCTMVMIDHLKDNTPAAAPDMIPFRKRLLTISGLKPEDVPQSGSR